MFSMIKKLSLTFMVFNIFTVQSLMADMMFYYSAAILPSIISSSQEVKLKEKLAGNTLYTSIYDELGTLESFTFDENLTTAGYQEIVGGNSYGTGTLVVDGMTLYYTCTSESGVEIDGCRVPAETIPLVFSDIQDDYVFLTTRGDIDKSLYTEKVFYDEAKARTYYLDNALKNYFEGQTKYYANEYGGNGYRTYNEDGTYTGMVDTMPVEGTFVLDEAQMSFTLTRSDGTILEFSHIQYYQHSEVFDLSIDGGTPFETAKYPEDFLANYFTGLRRDFENEFGKTGYRIYNENGTFTGEYNGSPISGTYTIDKYTMILNNSDGTVFTLTHKGADDYDGDSFQVFELNKNDDSTPFMTWNW